MKIRTVNANNINLDFEFIRKISDTTLKDENLSYRSVGLIKSSIQKGYFLMALDGSSRILGWIEKYRIWKNWWGLSTLYVFPEYRNIGVGRKILIPAGVKDLESKNIFAATTNKKIQLVLEKLGFKQVRLNELPFMVKANLMLMRYLNIKGLIKLVKIKSKGFSYFVKSAQ
jgi:N-acetylglutamate synthase-like GNAT family acetyltransferase